MQFFPFLFATAHAASLELVVLPEPAVESVEPLLGPVTVELVSVGSGVQFAIPGQESPLFLLVDLRSESLVCSALYTHDRHGDLRPAKPSPLRACSQIPPKPVEFESRSTSTANGLSIVFRSPSSANAKQQ